jgi:hypothetical protein
MDKTGFHGGAGGDWPRKWAFFKYAWLKIKNKKSRLNAGSIADIYQNRLQANKTIKRTTSRED